MLAQQKGISPALTDLSDDLNRQDARAKLNRALDRNDDAALALWARTYGAEALDRADLAGDEDTDDLRDRVAGLRHAIDSAVGTIGEVVEDDDLPDDAAKVLSGVCTLLEAA